MKKYRFQFINGPFLLSTIISLFLIITTSIAHAEPSNLPSTDALVSKTITAWMEKNDIPGVAVEIYHNGTPHSYYFGYANREHKTPVTQKTIFEIGSFTKLFTGLLLAQGAIDNKVHFTDPVTKYLPALKSNPYFHEVTLERLGSHTGSLPFNVPETVQTTQALQQFLVNWKPTVPVGSSWEYSNLSIGLLGHALEASSGKTINELYLAQILKPLHMQPIGIHVPDTLQLYYAQGYDENGKTVQPTTTLFFPAAGSMRASSQDMAAFLQAAIGLPHTPEKITKAMRLTQTPTVSTAQTLQGLSWVIYPLALYSKETLLNPPTKMDRGPMPSNSVNNANFEPNALIDKTGGTEGFRSYIAVLPNKKSGIVLLANRVVSTGEIVKVSREILLNIDQ